MVKIENVTFHYGETNEQCLNNISLHIKKGECVLLCGESGCGKTTVTRLVNGLIPHFYEGEFSGTVTVAGKDVAVTTPDMLASTVGSVFQNPRSQFFNLDTTGEIAFGCENMGLPPDEIQSRIKKTAKELDIERLLDRDIFALSGGEKQLIAIAAAYALSPEIIVFDEPSSNLDWNACKELGKLMLRLKLAGKTLLIAEHRLYWLTELIDRVVYMKDGRIENEWQVREFIVLPEGVRTDLGLRVLKPDTLTPSAKVPDTTASSLCINGLSAHYKNGEHVLCDISFNACPGEVIGIIGGNGAGKTTLARAMCGLHKKQSGEVTLGGKKLSNKARAGPFYLVMQESGYQLFTDSLENELLLSKNKKSRPASEKIDAILEKLSLTDFRRRHPMSLSGGQKQRAAIGTAMAHEAEVLIFDEPTSGLDYGNMTRVCNVIETLRNQGKIIFIITHDYELLLASCTRVLILRDGEIKSDFLLSDESVIKIREVFS